MKEYEIIVNERVIEAINFVLEVNFAQNKADFARNFNIKPSKFSEILKKRMTAGMDIIQKLCSEYQISAEWLITGEGKMQKSSDHNNDKPEVADDNIKSLIGILDRTLLEKDKQIDKLLSIIEAKKV